MFDKGQKQSSTLSCDSSYLNFYRQISIEKRRSPLVFSNFGFWSVNFFLIPFTCTFVLYSLGIYKIDLIQFYMSALKN